MTSRTDASARGYRVREICEREGISRATAWRWIRKGVLVVSRTGPRTDVRVREWTEIRDLAVREKGYV